MWLLPIDWTQLELELAPGRYLVPPHYTAQELRKLSWLLSRGCSTRYALQLPWSRAAEQLSRLRPDEPALLVLSAPDHEDLDTTLDLAISSGHQWLLMLHTQHWEDAGYGWLEKLLKKPLIAMLHESFHDPRHPLASSHIRDFPLQRLTELTGDPVVLLDLLEATLAQWLDRAPPLAAGAQASLERSLHWVAGAHLASRIMRLPKERHAAALRLLLDPAGAPRQQAAADLQEVGLARVVARDIALDALARQLHEPLVRMGLAAMLPKEPDDIGALRRQLQRSQKHDSHTDLDERVDPGSVDFVTDDSAALALFARALGEDKHAAMAQQLWLDMRERRRQGLLPTAEQLKQADWAERMLSGVMRSSGRSRRKPLEAVGALIGIEAAMRPGLQEQREQRLEQLDRLRGLGLSELKPLMRELRFAHATALARHPQHSNDIELADELTSEGNDEEQHAATLAQRAYVKTQAGKLKEARTLARSAYTQAERKEDEQQRATALIRLGDIARREGELAKAEILFQEAYQTSRETGDETTAVAATHNRAIVAQQRGEPDKAEAMLREVIAIKRQRNDQRGVAMSLHQLASVLKDKQRLDEAETLLNEALSIHEAIEDLYGRAASLQALAQLQQARGDFDAARQRWEQLLDLQRKLKDEDAAKPTLAALGWIACRQGDHQRAAKLARMALDSNDHKTATLAKKILASVEPPA